MKMLPYRFKLPGIVLTGSGLVLAILYFTVRFRFEVPVLAVASSYVETRFFASFRTNFADETILLFLLTGFSLWVFSKEKVESDQVRDLRLRALSRALVTDFAFLLFSILFLYGAAFVAVLVMNIFLPFVLYLVFFYSLGAKQKNFP